MGLYPSGSSPSTASLTANETANLNRASPPFNVNNEASINAGLGSSALPNDFVQIPIYSYLQPAKDVEVLADDIDLYGCDYVAKVDARFPLDSTYTSVWWLMDALREPLQNCFNLTSTEVNNWKFMDLYSKCDII